MVTGVRVVGCAAWPGDPTQSFSGDAGESCGPRCGQEGSTLNKTQGGLTMNTGHITALVTGANRGLGKHFASQLVERGAKVYAGARRPETIELSGVEPVQLDITDPTSVRRAAEVAGDVNVLVNNAGTSTRASLLSGAFDDVLLEMETHYFGTL